VYAAVSCAAFGFAACNTYGDGLLSHAQDSASAGGASESANGGDTVTIVAGSSDLGGAPVAAGGGLGAGAGAGVGDAGAAGAAGTPETGGASTGGASGGHAGATNTTGGSAGSGTAGATGGGSSGGPAIELIDDFEDQNLVVLLMSKRNGPWYPINDGTKAGIQTMGVAVLTGTADARAGSASTAALHMTASGFTSWGAGVGADFVNTAGVKVPYDVSAYKGIRFYAKIGAGKQPAMKLLIPTTYSDPLGGKCNNTASPPAGTACNDHLFCPINSLKATWDVYECDFSDLMQQSFGLPQAKLDPTSVYGLQFTLATTPLAADFWLDDVAFLLK
jgi:hypothetical protein